MKKLNELSTPAAHEVTLREHLLRARKFAKPENMARDPRKMKKAALKRWEGKRKKDIENKARHVGQNKQTDFP